MGLVSELRRRNVLRMVVLYVVAAWLIMQVAEVVIDLANLPDWIGPTILGLVAIGFPIALIFSWFYELTPGGISLEKDIDPAESMTHVTGRRMDFIVISLLCAAVILFAYDKWWIGEPPEQSIAVLPFENMSADPEQEYFSDGISEELLNVLAQLPGLRVAARTSSFQFKGQYDDIANIAEQLNVAHILEGSVRRSGNKLRITAQLIKADDGYHLWSGSYDREFDDIFAVQDEIAAAISDALKVKLALGAGEPVRPTVIKAANTDSYEAYLHGRELIHQRGREALEEAVRYLERSLRLDDNFAPAHAQLAIATILLLDSPEGYGTLSLEEVRRIAIPHLDRAQELGPDLADVYAGRALLLLDSDLEGTIEYAQKTLALNPSYTDAMNWSRMALEGLGRYEEMEVTLKQMLVTDPISIIGRISYARWLGLRGRVEEAHEIADQMLAQGLAAGYPTHMTTAMYYEGKVAEALAWGLRVHVQDPNNPRSHLAQRFIWIGEYDEARRIAGMSRAYVVDVAEERFDEAIELTQKKVQLDPENQAVIEVAANVLYDAGRIDKALPLYERLRDFRPKDRPIGSPRNVSTMRLALARRKTGDVTGGNSIAQISKQDVIARREAGEKNQFLSQTEAMLAAFENSPDLVIAALKSAMQYGHRDPQFFGDPVFEALWGEPIFIALQHELDAILEAEHSKVLQLICFNNPVPGGWQPLPQTCEGVKEQLAL